MAVVGLGMRGAITLSAMQGARFPGILSNMEVGHDALIIAHAIYGTVTEFDTMVWTLRRRSRSWEERIKDLPGHCKVQGTYRGVREVSPYSSVLSGYYGASPTSDDWKLDISRCLKFEETPLLCVEATSYRPEMKLFVNESHKRAQEWEGAISEMLSMFQGIQDIDRDTFTYERKVDSVTEAYVNGVGADAYVETVTGIAESAVADSPELIESMCPENWIRTLFSDDKVAVLSSDWKN